MVSCYAYCRKRHQQSAKRSSANRNFDCGRLSLLPANRTTTIPCTAIVFLRIY